MDEIHHLLLAAVDFGRKRRCGRSLISFGVRVGFYFVEVGVGKLHYWAISRFGLE